MTTSIRVLIVDDQKLVRAGLCMLCEATEGLEVVGEAADGEQAIRMAAELAPDVILMDLRMPVLDGLAATRILRRLEHPEAKPIPIIAMTADAFTESIEEAKKAGMNGYVTKPIEPEKLYQALAQ